MGGRQRTDSAAWKRERGELESALTNARERVAHTRSLCESQVDEARAEAAKALEERQALLQYAQHLEGEMAAVRDARGPTHLGRGGGQGEWARVSVCGCVADDGSLVRSSNL